MFKYIFITFLLFLSFVVSAQVENKDSDILFYRKKELNSGVRFGLNSNREELLTDNSRKYIQTTNGVANFQFSNNYWRFLERFQEQITFNFEVGPMGGIGNWVDSANVEDINADHNLFGIRGYLSIDYSNRYYYNSKNYTLIEVNGWAHYDWFKQNSTGTAIDSFGNSSEYSKSTTETKLRYGFDAKAGWGWGRLNPMNNYMLAHYILEKYYAGRNFSEQEIRNVAAEIYRIKSERDILKGHNSEVESQIVANFLNEKMFLTLPDNLKSEWENSESLARFNGVRFEVGPFFRYFNREPDFIYGAFIQYENEKYSSLKWNRNFGVGLKYSRYKIKRDNPFIGNGQVENPLDEQFEGQDWVNAVINIGWSYFPDLKRQFDFGVKYIPSVELNNFSELGRFNHGLVPYIGYFSQINSKSRMNFTFAYRISKNEKMMLPGPEFSLAFYRSRY